MLDARAFREDLELETVIGNITAVIYHQGENFWVVNHFPWYAGGIHQCICTTIRENGEQGTKHYYPVQYNWVDKMVYVGRENIGVEWLGVEREVGESGYRKKIKHTPDSLSISHSGRTTCGPSQTPATSSGCGNPSTVFRYQQTLELSKDNRVYNG